MENCRQIGNEEKEREFLRINKPSPDQNYIDRVLFKYKWQYVIAFIV